MPEQLRVPLYVYVALMLEHWLYMEVLYSNQVDVYKSVLRVALKKALEPFIGINITEDAVREVGLVVNDTIRTVYWDAILPTLGNLSAKNRWKQRTMLSDTNGVSLVHDMLAAKGKAWYFSVLGVCIQPGCIKAEDIEAISPDVIEAAALDAGLIGGGYV
jgi:hypothetical protein